VSCYAAGSRQSCGWRLAIELLYSRLPMIWLTEYETSDGLDSLNERLEEGYETYEKSDMKHKTK
jgi:hypothetical protein